MSCSSPCTHLDPTLQLIGVDLADRPDGLHADITWTDSVPGDAEALLIANEWLDNVPVEVVELTDAGWRLVLVDPATGSERLGPPPDEVEQAWLNRWWPAGEVGDRAEVGRPRDEAWAAAVGSLRRGLAVAVDYAHRRDSRPPSGTLTGYRGGRQVPPVPDGSCDITSHVALDACATAGEAQVRPTACSPRSAQPCAHSAYAGRCRRTSCRAPTRPATSASCRSPARWPS